MYSRKDDIVGILATFSAIVRTLALRAATLDISTSGWQGLILTIREPQVFLLQSAMVPEFPAAKPLLIGYKKSLYLRLQFPWLCSNL